MLINVVLHLGQCRLDAVIQDEEGRRRKVAFSWLEKSPDGAPPAHWVEAIRGEVEFRRSLELAPGPSG